MHEPARRIPYRTWPGALAIALAIGGYVGGLTWYDRQLPGVRSLAGRKTVQVGHVRFAPAAGWDLDVSRSRTGQSLMLVKGPGRFLVTTSAWAGGPDGPLVRQQRLMERAQGLQLTGDITEFINPWGVQGVTFAYFGPTLTGRFWQVVDPQRRSLVQVDFYSANDAFADALVEAQSMVDAMDMEAPL